MSTVLESGIFGLVAESPTELFITELVLSLLNGVV